MAGANIKVGVTGVNEFKQDINKVKQSVQTLNSALELNEKQFKATGNAEEYLKTKAELLKTKIDQQNSIIETAEKALKQMTDNGVDKASNAFQSMQRTLLNAKSELVDTQTQLKTLGTDADGAKTSAEAMNKELKNIGKGVSWKNISDGIGKINDKLESGAKAAIRMGKYVINMAKDSTSYADELLTRSAQMGVDVETLQKMDRVAEFIDTDVDTIVTAKDRLAKNRGKLSDLMGISTDGKSDEDLFWEVGEALANMGEGFDKAEAAQQIFGKSWRELAPLFAAGKDEYDALMEGQSVLTEEKVRKLGEADDAIKKVELELQKMKNEFWANNADKITGLFQWFVDNQDAVTGALMVIGGGFAAMKLAETASNVMEIVSGLQTLGLIKGAGAAASGAAGAAGAAGGTGAAAGGGLAAGLLPSAGVVAAAILPAILANESAYASAREKQAQRLANAGNLGTEGWFLEQSANALGITNGRLGDYGAIQSLLMGMGDRSDLEKSKLYNMLSGSVTDQGNKTWNELQRLWGGEEMDMGRMTSILEAVTSAYDRMAQVNEELTGGTDKQSKTNSEMAAAVAGLEGLPGDIAAAVSKAPINVNIDGTLMTNYFNSQLGPALAAANE